MPTADASTPVSELLKDIDVFSVQLYNSLSRNLDAGDGFLDLYKRGPTTSCPGASPGGEEQKVPTGPQDLATINFLLRSPLVEVPQHQQRHHCPTPTDRHLGLRARTFPLR
ncbi:uncharacterized protein Z518_02677 [Rhinocladiella mackenziei CBS 650.93]|uniref:Uncharacterized protein n=1 Tax=Rhinocladiella mackenziei CBS 650.93 TaxID=1442369 RepID=A0A0D2G0K9_9EURO|nr:uncharacterized protein Z518_02677 [Rhinocladiella mackenziei CBS 650.93]KIX08022.1 hypothetical protein Z518_02677 [Rhinocladiella mackenziei CBS 650.93]